MNVQRRQEKEKSDVQEYNQKTVSTIAKINVRLKAEKIKNLLEDTIEFSRKTVSIDKRTKPNVYEEKDST